LFLRDQKLVDSEVQILSVETLMVIVWKLLPLPLFYVCACMACLSRLVVKVIICLLCSLLDKRSENIHARHDSYRNYYPEIIHSHPKAGIDP